MKSSVSVVGKGATAGRARTGENVNVEYEYEYVQSNPRAGNDVQRGFSCVQETQNSDRSGQVNILVAFGYRAPIASQTNKVFACQYLVVFVLVVFMMGVIMPFP
jgi:hypothetical protein